MPDSTQCQSSQLSPTGQGRTTRALPGLASQNRQAKHETRRQAIPLRIVHEYNADNVVIRTVLATGTTRNLAKFVHHFVRARHGKDAAVSAKTEFAQRYKNSVCPRNPVAADGLFAIVHRMDGQTVRERIVTETNIPDPTLHNLMTKGFYRGDIREQLESFFNQLVNRDLWHKDNGDYVRYQHMWPLPRQAVPAYETHRDPDSRTLTLATSPEAVDKLLSSPGADGEDAKDAAWNNDSRLKTLTNVSALYDAHTNTIYVPRSHVSYTVRFDDGDASTRRPVPKVAPLPAGMLPPPHPKDSPYHRNWTTTMLALPASEEAEALTGEAPQRVQKTPPGKRGTRLNRPKPGMKMYVKTRRQPATPSKVPAIKGPAISTKPWDKDLTPAQLQDKLDRLNQRGKYAPQD